MRAFDLFCGAGGLTRGLRDAGIEVVAGVDKEERCRGTYLRNNPGSKFLHRDVGDLELVDLGLSGPMPTGNGVLFAGCAPCQPFSHHRKAPRRPRDATLLGRFARLVEEALPDFVLIENVPGMARVPGNSTFHRFVRTLDILGYDEPDCAVLDAQNYGVPQRRRRLVLMAARHGVVRPGALSLPPAIHGEGLRPIETVRRAIGGLPPLAAGERHPRIPNHVAARVSALNLERLRATPHDGGGRRSWPTELRLACHREGRVGHTDVYGRMRWDAPAPALTSRCNSISNGRYGHPEQDRAISLREAAALQSFPDDYEFLGSQGSVALQIGNAVPVKLAMALGETLLRLPSASGAGRRRRKGRLPLAA